MRKLAILTVLSLVPASMALAQGAMNDEVNAELDRMYSSRAVKNAPSVQVNVTNTNSNTDTARKQATTVIEAAPLSESKALSLRRARQDEEMRTEVQMVERLEAARIEDEKRRSEQLFGNRFNVVNNIETTAPVTIQTTTQTNKIEQTAIGNSGSVSQAVVIAAPVVAAPVASPVVAAPAVVAAPVVIAAPAVVSAPAIVSVPLAEVVPVEAKSTSRSFIMGSVGLGEYPNAKNVRGNYSGGFSVGTHIDDSILVEGAFAAANYDVQQFDSGPYGYSSIFPRITSMNQYSLQAALKYQILGGSFRPVIGGVLGYTYRTFTDTQLGFANNDASSHAFDAGLVIGADLEISKSLALGLDFRYMTNLWNRAQNKGLQTRFGESVIGGGTPIEKINYAVTSLNLRYTF
jgi:outer membrane protein W